MRSWSDNRPPNDIHDRAQFFVVDRSLIKAARHQKQGRGPGEGCYDHSVDQNAVTLRVTPETAEQALLLVIFDHTTSGSETITRRQLLDQLGAIPGLKIPRPDRVLETCIRDGDVAVMSNSRIRRYALTSNGEAKAKRAILDISGSERGESDE